jgi:hypothetical protein
LADTGPRGYCRAGLARERLVVWLGLVGFEIMILQNQ